MNNITILQTILIYFINKKVDKKLFSLFAFAFILIIFFINFFQSSFLAILFCLYL